MRSLHSPFSAAAPSPRAGGHCVWSWCRLGLLTQGTSILYERFQTRTKQDCRKPLFAPVTAFPPPLLTPVLPRPQPGCLPACPPSWLPSACGQRAGPAWHQQDSCLQQRSREPLEAPSLPAERPVPQGRQVRPRVYLCFKQGFVIFPRSTLRFKK